MADVVQTAANVGIVGSGVSYSTFQAGEAIDQGDFFYKKAADNLHYKADADASEAAATALGMCVTKVDAANQYFIGATGGEVDVGATLTEGTIYVLSDTAGGMKPAADLASGDYTVYLGTGNSSGNLDMNIDVTGNQVP